MACSKRTELGFVLALVALPVWAAAPGLPVDPVEQRAREAATAGKKAFDAGDFEGAIRKYEEANAIKPAPALLFNLGQSHRRVKNVDAAIFYFRRYLETNPPIEQSMVVERLVTQLETERSEARRLDIEKTRLAAAEAEARKLELERSLLQTQTEVPAIYKRWWFWTAAGVVVVGAGVGIGAYAATSSRGPTTTLPDINAR